jgi:hypothetical protein
LDFERETTLVLVQPEKCINRTKIINTETPF